MAHDIVKAAVFRDVAVEHGVRFGHLPLRAQAIVEIARTQFSPVDPATVEGFFDQRDEFVEDKVGDGPLPTHPDITRVLRPERHIEVAQMACCFVPIEPPRGGQPGQRTKGGSARVLGFYARTLEIFDAPDSGSSPPILAIEQVILADFPEKDAW